MNPETSTQLLLQKLLDGGELSKDERTILTNRLDAFDDDTAAALDALDAEDLALALDAPSAANAVAPAPVRWLLPASAGGLALAASVALTVFIATPPSDGRKGAFEPAQVHLLAREGLTEDGGPVAGALLASGARVAADSAVLFRYRASEAGWGYLLAQGDGSPMLLHETGHRRAGEYEVADRDHALALVPRELGTTVVVMMLVSPNPLDDVDWSALPSLDGAALDALCPSCGHHGLLLRSGGAP